MLRNEHACTRFCLDFFGHSLHISICIFNAAFNFNILFNIGNLFLYFDFGQYLRFFDILFDLNVF